MIAKTKNRIAFGMGILLAGSMLFIINKDYFRGQKEIVKPTDTIQKLKHGTPVTIAALGDSLTYGWMVNKGYISFLEDMICEKYPGCRLTILNRGIPGDTAQGGLSRLQNDVIKYKPDLVFIQFALNDAFSGYTPEQYKNYISVIIDQITEGTDAEIFLVTSVCLIDQMANRRANSFYDILDELASDNELPIAMVHEYMRKKIDNELQLEHLIQSDGVHPNDDGHRLMAEAVMEVF